METNERKIGVIAYKSKVEITLNEKGFFFGNYSVKTENILFLNRYVSVKSLVPEVVHTLVFKVDEYSVSMYEFKQNTDLKDTKFEDKLLFWVKNNNIDLQENDWNGFCPIVNGYLSYTYIDPRKPVFSEDESNTQEDAPRTVNALTLGIGIAGLLITIVGAVMTGLGNLRFGIIGLVLGVLAFICGAVGVIKKK